MCIKINLINFIFLMQVRMKKSFVDLVLSAFLISQWHIHQKNNI